VTFLPSFVIVVTRRVSDRGVLPLRSRLTQGTRIRGFPQAGLTSSRAASHPTIVRSHAETRSPLGCPRRRGGILEPSASIIGPLVGIAVFLILLVAGIWTFRRVHGSPSIGDGVKWTLVLLSLALGLGSTCVHYSPNPDMQVHGVPIPIAILQREGDHWVDFVMDHAMIPVVVVINLVLVAFLIHAIALVWIAIRARRTRRAAARQTPSVDRAN